MSFVRNVFVACLAGLVLAGCGSTKLASCEDGRDVLWFSSPTKLMLNSGIKNYENGNYPAATALFQAVLDHKDASSGEKVEANKHMAFIHCVSSREKQCRDSFKKAIELNPDFDLTPAEVGHPVWGPVFRSVKKAQSK